MNSLRGKKVGNGQQVFQVIVIVPSDCLKLNVLWGRNVIGNTYYTIMDKEEGLRG